MQNIIDKIRTGVKKLRIPKGIEAIYLYGSILKNKLRKDSDVDIAILPSYETDIFERLELISRVEAIFVSLLARLGLKNEISVLDLRGKYTSFLISYIIITEGILIYEKERKQRMEFENSVKREYFDFVPYLLFLRRVKCGNLHQKI